MSDQTPERLQAFRAQYQPPARSGRGWFVVLALLLVAGFAGVFALLLLPSSPVRKGAVPAGASAGLDAETQRQYAAYLAEKNLPQEAIAAYETYLDKAPLDNDARAKIQLGIAKLAIDTKQYERALANLYQAEMLAPKSDLKPEIDKRIVQCLDVLGRSSDLKRELKGRTSLKRTAQDVKPGETVLAEFSGQVITDRDLDNEIDKLPASARKTFDDPEKRKDLLKNMVVERVLLDKAVRQGLDEDPKIQEHLAQERDQLIVRRLIEDQVRSKVIVTPEDAERFYKAESARFTTPGSAEVRIESAATKQDAEAMQEWKQAPVTVREGGRLPNVAKSDDFVKDIFVADAGKRVGPTEIDGKWYIAEVVSKKPAQVHPYEEVKDQALQMLQYQKEQEQLQDLLDETLKSQGVALHLERLAPSEGSATPSATSASEAKASS
ncbi:MAG TPA: peptidyl-prolyl cis-trans isomerase [Candidatus Hydrogenedentes bacterium]|nr:peptidyl-prolyl cis-trans isomerase [Candidatus Hydrogenedentota bacterium]